MPKDSGYGIVAPGNTNSGIIKQASIHTVDSMGRPGMGAFMNAGSMKNDLSVKKPGPGKNSSYKMIGMNRYFTK